jgi:hypothetical protein
MDVTFHAGRCRSIFSDLRGTLPVSHLCILKGKPNKLVVYYPFNSFNLDVSAILYLAWSHVGHLSIIRCVDIVIP